MAPTPAPRHLSQAPEPPGNGLFDFEWGVVT